ncbi:hypothetical protein M0L20_16580 [Spirosoma sp. RP8]|uniref:Uncharacterized protein n=1 Tax=Spirosoma liriopis TaxID=2937440 RepID=A0ABT0HMU6_9BACT|nr:hypothetical protein [Spirosoma liriopis]MCK8493486.1 hypothetical protein [Spirosoma liriopis]
MITSILHRCIGLTFDFNKSKQPEPYFYSQSLPDRVISLIVTIDNQPFYK